MREERNFGRPWVVLCMILAVHVVDEAMTDFLSVYNPVVMELRQELGFPWLPTFTFATWSGLLALVVVSLLAASPLAYRGQRELVPVGYAFAAMMLLNGVGHLGVSLWRREWTSGVYTSPLVLAGALYLWASLRNLKQK